MSTGNKSSVNESNLSRRKFIRDSAVIAGTGIALSMPLISSAGTFFKPDGTYTVKQVMDKFISQVPGGAKTDTVDTLKSGSPDIVVTGILTTMFATVDIIHKAITLGANFIIAHEPTFYNHADNTDWLKDDDVYQYKANLLKEHKIAVWRNHDYIHTIQPDPVTSTALKMLEWDQYSDKDTFNLLTMSSTPLHELISHAKKVLRIDTVRYIGDLSMPCRRVMYMPGAPGGLRQITNISKLKPNVLFCGELSEWETAEYVRDAKAKGDNIALVVMGHIASEEPGSQFMLEWLNKNIPGVKVNHISPGNSLKFY
jgi:putative NIF3 family GTP cyclohydrolase 1 type 2